MSSEQQFSEQKWFIDDGGQMRLAQAKVCREASLNIYMSNLEDHTKRDSFMQRAGH